VRLMEESNEEASYLILRDFAGLVALVQMGVLEIHVWGSRAGQPDAPDRLVFDLDPDPEVAWAAVVVAAKEVRERFAQLGLAAFVKTTGGKGLHVVVPVQPDAERLGWDKAKAFCRAMARAMELDSPGRYLSVASKARRKGKIYIDYLRNGRGATAIAPYSTRARPGATVATPLAWEELDTTTSSSDFTVATIPARLARLQSDPWQTLVKIRQTLPRSLL